MVDRDVVFQCLEQVNDPHVPVSLRRMGMLDDVIIEGGLVTVHLTVPCLGCPAVNMLKDQIREAVAPLRGVTEVRVETLWGANWQRQNVDPSAHPLLRQFGLQI